MIKILLCLVQKIEKEKQDLLKRALEEVSLFVIARNTCNKL